MNSSSSSTSLHEALVDGRRRLVDAGLRDVTAEIDVEVLARHVLGWDRATLLVRRRDPAPDGFAAALDRLIERRAVRVPVAYLTGHREFWGLDFEVTSDVLVPRPESELIVEEVLAALRADGWTPGMPLRVLDIGTGSGCLALSIAHELEGVAVVATDASTSALRVAQRNARRLGLEARVHFVAADLVTPLQRTKGWVDVLVSNPPYVPVGSWALMPDVERYEPPLALYGGATGLSCLARLVVDAAAAVRPGGRFIFEFGDGQEDDVVALVKASGAWAIDRVRADLQEIPRTCVARRISA